MSILCGVVQNGTDLAVVAPHLVHSSGGTQPLWDALSYNFVLIMCFFCVFRKSAASLAKKEKLLKDSEKR